MGERSNIEWTDATLNPIRARNRETGKVGWFCEHASPGCINCYSETFNVQRLGNGVAYRRQSRDLVELFLDEKMLMQPLHWRKPRRVFWNSMTDTFGEFVPEEMIDKQFAVMARTPWHTHLVLTKRADLMQRYLCDPERRNTVIDEWRRLSDARSVSVNLDGTSNLSLRGWPLPNVWLGVSIEDRPRLHRLAYLRETPAAVRFISFEPLLEDLGPLHLAGIDWAIAGGESGPRRRHIDPDWMRSIRDQCEQQGTKFFGKQLDKVTPLPPDLLVRQMPERAE